MSSEIRLYNPNGMKITTLQPGVVPIVFDRTGPNPALKYNGNEVARIESDANSTFAYLEIKVTDGSFWVIKSMLASATATSESTFSQGVVSLNSTLKMTYPAVQNFPFTWVLSDEDGPPVTLKVVVRRIP